MPKPKDRVSKKRSARKAEDDDSSVDSEGNIRNLIDYDYDESSGEEVFEMEDVPKRAPRKPRKAAVSAAKKISKMAKKTTISTDSSDSEYKAPKKRPTLVVVESESDSEEEVPKKKKVAAKKAPVKKKAPAKKSRAKK